MAGHKGYITVGLYNDGRPGEIFITMAKQGSTISGLMDSFATMSSFALQYGVPLKFLVQKIVNARYEPSGYTGNPEIPFAKSISDYIFRWLGQRFLSAEEQAEIGLSAADSTVGGETLEPELELVGTALTTSNGRAEDALGFVPQLDAPLCHLCGSLMVTSGNCYKCMNCGSTSGCS